MIYAKDGSSNHENISAAKKILPEITGTSKIIFCDEFTSQL